MKYEWQKIYYSSHHSLVASQNQNSTINQPSVMKRASTAARLRRCSRAPPHFVRCSFSGSPWCESSPCQKPRSQGASCPLFSAESGYENLHFFVFCCLSTNKRKQRTHLGGPFVICAEEDLVDFLRDAIRPDGLEHLVDILDDVGPQKRIATGKIEDQNTCSKDPASVSQYCKYICSCPSSTLPPPVKEYLA